MKCDKFENRNAIWRCEDVEIKWRHVCLTEHQISISPNAAPLLQKRPFLWNDKITGPFQTLSTPQTCSMTSSWVFFNCVQLDTVGSNAQVKRSLQRPTRASNWTSFCPLKAIPSTHNLYAWGAPHVHSHCWTVSYLTLSLSFPTHVVRN